MSLASLRWAVFASLPRLSVASLALAFLAPGHYLPWMSFWNDAAAGIALLLFFLWLLSGLQPGSSLQPGAATLPARALLILSLPLIPWCQYGFGLLGYFGDAWVVSLYLLGTAVAYLAGLLLRDAGVDKEDVLVCLAKGVLLACIVSTWIALRQAFGQTNTIFEVEVGMGVNWRAVGNLAQPNQFSSLILLGIVSGFYLHVRQCLSRPVTVLLVLFLGLALAAAMSRTAVLVLLVLVFWALRGSWSSNSTFSRRTSLLFTVLSGVLAIEWFTWPWLIEVWSQSEFIFREAKDPIRLTLWTQFLDASMRAPLWGYGWNQIASAQVLVANQYPPSMYVNSAHNLFLDIILWNGWVLGGAMVCIISVWLARWLLRCSSSSDWYCIAMLWVLGIHSMLEYPLHYAYFLLLLGFVAGVLDLDRSDIKVVGMPRILLWGLLFVGGVGLYFVCTEYPKAEDEIRKSRFIGARFDTMEESFGLRQDQKSSEIRFLTQLSAAVEIFKLSYVDDKASVSDVVLRQAVERYPFAPVLFHQALVAARNGDAESGRKYFCLIRQLHGETAFVSAVRALHAKQMRIESLRVMGGPVCGFQSSNRADK